MKETAISIIIPVYNVEKYLRECLDSIIQQGFQEYEIICVNDASPDNSEKILLEYAAQYAQIKVLNHSENRGLSAARNTGLMSAGGKYVLFVDSDDMIAQGMLQDLYYTAEQQHTDMVGFDIVFLCEDRDYRNKFLNRIKSQRIDGVYSGKELFCKLAFEGHMKNAACQWFIKREFLKEYHIKFYEGILHEDELFSFLCFMNAQRVMYIEKDYYVYRQRNGSIMATKDYRRAESLFVILIQILTYWNSHVFTDRENQAIEKFFLNLTSAYHSYSCFGQKTEKLTVGGYVEKAVYDALQRKKNKYLVLDEGQFEQIEKADNVIVFGAGYAAAEIVNMLRARKLEISVIAVSNMDRNPKMFGGYKVDAIENVACYMKNAVVVIGVTKKYRLGICEKLMQLGYCDIIVPYEVNEL